MLKKRYFDEKFSREFFIKVPFSCGQSTFLTAKNGHFGEVRGLFWQAQKRIIEVKSHKSLIHKQLQKSLHFGLLFGHHPCCFWKSPRKRPKNVSLHNKTKQVDRNTEIGRCSNERTYKRAPLPHLPILPQYLFTMLLCLITRLRSVCLLCYSV